MPRSCGEKEKELALRNKQGHCAVTEDRRGTGQEK